MFSKKEQIQRIEINEIANKLTIERPIRAKKDSYKTQLTTRREKLTLQEGLVVGPIRDHSEDTSGRLWNFRRTVKNDRICTV